MKSLTVDKREFDYYIRNKTPNNINEFLLHREVEILEFLRKSYKLNIIIDESYEKEKNNLIRFSVVAEGNNSLVKKYIQENGPFYIFVKEK